jgi:hypothetical protein
MPLVVPLPGIVLTPDEVDPLGPGESLGHLPRYSHTDGSIDGFSSLPLRVYDN